MNKIKMLLLAFMIALSSLIAFSNSYEDNNLEVLNEELLSEDSSSSSNISLKAIAISLGAVGDSTLIKFGDTEILIDAGGDKNSGKYISAKLKEYVEDKKLEYVIMTHADSDHIVNFGAIFDSGMKIDTLIDFDVTEDSTLAGVHKEGLFISGVYKEYARIRSTRLITEDINYYYTASECTYESRKDKNGNPISRDQLNHSDAKNIFTLYSNPVDSTGETAELKILYNYFYDHVVNPSSEVSAVDRNMISVCSLITYDEQKYLFTGDLEEFGGYIKDEQEGEQIEVDYASSQDNYTRSNAGGESKLFLNNQEDLKGGVLFFKAGHHGSLTSNSDYLLSKIRPQYIAIETVIDGQYKFPRDRRLREMSRYTDYIYLTDIKVGEEIKQYHGNIEFVYTKEDGMKVNCSNTNMKKSIFECSEIFEARSPEIGIYNLIPENITDLEKINAVYIKIGHIDILINPGCLYSGLNNKATVEKSIYNKVKYLCNDKVIDYFIMTDDFPESYMNFPIDNLISDGLKINTSIFPTYSSRGLEKDFTQQFNSLKSKVLKITTNSYSSSEVNGSGVGLVYNATDANDSSLENVNNLIARLYFPEYDGNVKQLSYTKSNSTPVLLDVDFNCPRNHTYGSYLYMNNLFNGKSESENEEDVNNFITNNYELIKNKIMVFQLPQGGYSSKVNRLDNLKILNEGKVKSGAKYMVNGIVGSKNVNDQVFFCKKYMNYVDSIYGTMILKETNNIIKVTKAPGDIYTRITVNFSAKRKLITGLQSQVYCFNMDVSTSETTSKESKLFNGHRLDEYWSIKNEKARGKNEN